jgi:hypothetical protein
MIDKTQNKLEQVAQKNSAYDITFVGGSLFAKFTNKLSADKCHIALKNSIGEETGVNMYELRDSEYVFDFVPAKDEAPVFTDVPDDVDTMLNLEIEQGMGK